jgi:thiamine biosynthesis lipoprotein
MPGRRRRSTRRDFLKGKSAVDAIEDASESLVGRDAAGSSQPASEPTESRSYLIQVGRRAMACQFDVLLNAHPESTATEHAIEALDLVDELEDQLSVYRHRSEVSQLNAVAAKRPLRVERRLFALLQQSVEIYRQTCGAFDITSGPLIQLWRLARREGRLPTPEAIQEAVARVGSDKLELNADEQTVRFLAPDSTVDLGAIGKGYALDRCAELLAARGLESYLIHGGTSSVLARGSRQSGADPSGWTVGVQHPLRRDARLLELKLCDRAIGTSGAGTHQLILQGRRYGHILDPRTGYPVEGILSASVVAPDAARADALSTAFYVLGLDATRAYCERFPEITALLTTHGTSANDVELHALNAERLEWKRVADRPAS